MINGGQVLSLGIIFVALKSHLAQSGTKFPQNFLDVL